jgi:dTDP-4-amino-4,6-dideoxygalactose transaminase
MKFPLIRPDVPETKAWLSKLTNAYEIKHFSNAGKIWQGFNEAVMHQTGVIAAVGVANNTVGQVAALHAIDIQDKLVFISNFTFPATLQAVHMAGGIPLVCDADSENWEISLDSIKRSISKFGKPRVVLATRIFGRRLDHYSLINFLKSEGIDLIFDAAAAFPISKIDQDMTSLKEVYSLHATKAFGIGEGGIVTGPKSFVDKVWQHSNFGFSENQQEFLDGNNAKMDEFAAARAIAALEGLNQTSARRKNFVKEAYAEIFDGSQTQHIDVKSEQLWSLFPIRFENTRKLAQFSQHLLSKNILSKKYYSPSMRSGYRGEKRMICADDLDVSESLAQQVLCLPVYSEYTQDEVEYIRKAVIEAYEKIQNE